ncbi:MAG: DoxX family membrane protein [Bacteroidetes bacterium]|nr:DoxX family membrane protein [Bacteroidota bacterium]MBL7067378.1 DoxX family membrane protein [Candidatus Neomarinimicrobiota bacterium]
MKKTTVKSTIAIIIRLILGFLFLYASLDKIIYPSKFAEIIYNYRVLPVELVNICAILVPWIEVFIGIMLLIGIWIDASAFMLSSITFVFTFLIISAIFRGLNIECGCFSLDAEGSLVSWKRVIEDIFILIGGLYLVWFNWKR